MMPHVMITSLATDPWHAKNKMRCNHGHHATTNLLAQNTTSLPLSPPTHLINKTLGDKVIGATSIKDQGTVTVVRETTLA